MQPHEQLEAEIGWWAGVENVVACSSGTSALHLALEAMRLPLGSEVICPDLTMVAVPRAVVLAGLTPVFVDCGNDLLMDFGLIPPAGQFKALIVVHIYGRRWSTERLSPNEVFPVIEDMAELHGVTPHPRSDAACWSHYKNKLVAGEEGGAVAFKNPEHAILARKLRSLGFTDAHDFDHIPRGHNYRMSNAHASLILGSLRQFDRNVEMRRTSERWYDEACPPQWKMPARQSPWVYDIRVPGMTWGQQNEVVSALQDAGILARHAFKPMHTQREFHQCKLFRGATSKALVASREVIYLPLDPTAVSRQTVQRAFDVIHQTLANSI